MVKIYVKEVPTILRFRKGRTERELVVETDVIDVADSFVTPILTTCDGVSLEPFAEAEPIEEEN